MNFIKSIKEFGFLGTIRKGLRSFLGINKQDEAIDSMYYYLNNYIIDASTLPPTKDIDLRYMQQCDAALLNILDKIFRKHNLTYWLDFGTLLGARRHKGIIPWDDDTDISMPREDYNKAVEIIKNELNDTDFDTEQVNGRIGVGYKHAKTGIWCDIFPVDTYKASGDFDKSLFRLKEKINKFRYFYIKNMMMPYETMQQHRISIIEDEVDSTYEIIYHGREFNHQHPRAFYELDEIFPTSTIEFEGYMLSAPANVHKYLEKIFGKNYMHLPKSGILHHGDNKGALSTWASKSNINMDETLTFLINYADRI